MQIQEAYELDVVMFGLVPGPLGETLGFDAFEGLAAGVRFAAGVCADGVAVPFEGVAAV